MPPRPKRYLLRVASLLLSGAVACDEKEDPWGDPQPDYGVIGGDWVDIGGTVVDAVSGDPIHGIGIEALGREVQTAEDGSWELYMGEQCTDGCTVTATDLDGTLLGEYEETTVEAEPERIRTGGSGVAFYEDLDIVIEMQPVE